MAEHNGVRSVIQFARACPFCAYSLEKNLKQIEGVEGLVIDINQGTAILTPQAGKTIDVKSVPAAIKDAGFTPRDLRVSATGRIEGRPDGATLVAADGTQLFRLEPNDVASSVSTDDGQIYEVKGTIVSPKDGDENPGLLLLALSQATTKPGEK